MHVGDGHSAFVSSTTLWHWPRSDPNGDEGGAESGHEGGGVDRAGDDSDSRIVGDEAHQSDDDKDRACCKQERGHSQGAAERGDGTEYDQDECLHKADRYEL